MPASLPPRTEIRPEPRKAIVPELAGRILEYLSSTGASAGVHLTAQALGDHFGVSRWTVSQALKLLTAKGALRHETNRGYFVRDGKLAAPEQLGLSTRPELTQIYFRIAEDRLRGNLKDHVTETYLRQTYQLTHRQLSELLNKISREGWAERRIGYGWTFSPILQTPQSLQQTYSLRLALEPASLLESTFNLTPEVAGRLREVERQILAGGADTMSADALYERAVQFHEALAEASQNPFFIDVLRRVNRVRRLLVYQAMVDRQRYYGQSREHLQILDLLEAGRNIEAAEIMRHHLQGVLVNVQGPAGQGKTPAAETS